MRLASGSPGAVRLAVGSARTRPRSSTRLSSTWSGLTVAAQAGLPQALRGRIALLVDEFQARPGAEDEAGTRPISPSDGRYARQDSKPATTGAATLRSAVHGVHRTPPHPLRPAFRSRGGRLVLDSVTPFPSRARLACGRLPSTGRARTATVPDAGGGSRVRLRDPAGGTRVGLLPGVGARAVRPARRRHGRRRRRLGGRAGRAPARVMVRTPRAGARSDEDRFAVAVVLATIAFLRCRDALADRATPRRSCATPSMPSSRRPSRPRGRRRRRDMTERVTRWGGARFAVAWAPQHPRFRQA
jgi:hypothetical protein